MQKTMIFRVAQRCVSGGLYYRQCNQLPLMKRLSTDQSVGSSNDNHQNTNSSQSTDGFERRIFDKLSGDSSTSLYRKLDRIEKIRSGSSMDGDLRGFQPDAGEDGESFNTLSDGMEGKLKQAAEYFEVIDEETMEEGYNFRPDANWKEGMTYEPEDLDLRKPAPWKANIPDEFETTTKEVLKKADFRNVRFLANFLTDAGIIIKRSKTEISAKAQRKIAREIKTARAFGLLPFTTMGTKSFVFGQTMEDLESDYMVEQYDNPEDADVPDSI